MKEKKFDYRKYISQNKFEIGKVDKTSNFVNSVFEENSGVDGTPKRKLVSLIVENNLSDLKK